MNKGSLIIALVIICYVLVFSSNEVIAKQALPFDPVELKKSIDDFNENFAQRKRDREREIMIWKVISYTFIPLVIILFTWFTIKSKQTKKQKLYRLMAWYPLFSFAFIFYDFGLYPLPLLFIPVVIALWFHKHIPKTEVIFCSLVYFILLATVWGYMLILVALARASQGAGH